MPKTIKLASLKPNPDNPRYITEDKFEALKRSIRDFPEMMALRPMVVDEQGTVLGGNMRLKALAELGYQDIPADWVLKAKDLTEDQRREFVIKDNVGFGDWDWDIIANEWSDLPLEDWGLDVWEPEEEAKQRDEDIQALVTFDDEAARTIALKALEGLEGVKHIKEKG
jgi:ParB-like chromosome segregation protein Spo0J